MKKLARRKRGKAKGTKAKFKSSARRAAPKLKGRAPTKAKSSARRTVPKSRSKLKNVARKVAKAAVVAAGVAAVGTALGELSSRNEAPAEPGSNSGKNAPAERGSDDTEQTQ